MRILITGASGFIGSHIARALLGAGQEVRALVRPTSDRGVLKTLPLELFEGDLMAPEALTRACEGVDAVVHAAAVVRAHGPWQAFFDGVEGTKNLLASMARAGVARLVHVSSMGVYGLGRHAEPLRETTALEAKPASWNHYGREKLLMERLVWDAFAERKVEPVVVRPSATLGPGDRASLPAIFSALRFGKMKILGQGDNRVPFVVAEELATAIARAVGAGAAGRAYNLSGAAVVTQQEFLELCAGAIDVEPPRRRVPVGVAKLAATGAEWAHRAFGRKGAPSMSRLGIAVATTDAVVDCSAAARDLGWTGASPYAAAIQEAAECLEN